MVVRLADVHKGCRIDFTAGFAQVFSFELFNRPGKALKFFHVTIRKRDLAVGHLGSQADGKARMDGGGWRMETPQVKGRVCFDRINRILTTDGHTKTPVRKTIRRTCRRMGLCFWLVLPVNLSWAFSWPGQNSRAVAWFKRIGSVRVSKRF